MSVGRVKLSACGLGTALNVERSAPRGAVFLSYASQDAEAARRIAEALRAGGVEVWFDQNELVGGDAWDAKIRGQIASCALFIPVISAATQARMEGYFRIEWKLAAQRTHAMAEAKPFLLPIVIDATRDAEAHVPAEFRAVQWTRLPRGAATAAYVARVAALLGSGAAQASPPAFHPEAGRTPASPPRRSPALKRAAALAVALVLGGVAVWSWLRHPAAESRAKPPREIAATTEKSPAVSADDNAVAVLPFRNLSGDKEQEYFSDGLTEEILNALRRERDLRVPGNASCFAFKDKGTPEQEIARALKVTRLVVGSVQRAGNVVRIRLTLWRASDGFTESLPDFTKVLADGSAIFALQDEVARAVVEKIARRAATRTVAVLTKNAEAYDAYLRGRELQTRRQDQAAEAARFFERAVALDPGFALAWTRLAQARFVPFSGGSGGQDRSPAYIAAMNDAVRRALDAQPNLPEALVVQANLLRFVEGDFPAAKRILDRAESLQPPTAELRDVQALLARDMGNWPDAFRFAHDALRLDPENGVHFYSYAGGIFADGGDYPEADRLFARAMAIQGPEAEQPFAQRVNLRLAWRGPEAALRLVERAPPGQVGVEFLRARLLFALGRREEARATIDAMEDVALTETSRDAGPTSRPSLLVALGREERAKRWAESIRALALQEIERGNRAPSVRRALIRADIVLGRREAAVAGLEEERRENERIKNSYQRLRNYARFTSYLYAALGDADAAIALLREPHARRGLDLRYNPDFEPIRNDPRFQELIRQQEAWAKSLPDPIDP